MPNTHHSTPHTSRITHHSTPHAPMARNGKTLLCASAVNISSLPRISMFLGEASRRDDARPGPWRNAAEEKHHQWSLSSASVPFSTAHARLSLKFLAALFTRLAQASSSVWTPASSNGQLCRPRPVLPLEVPPITNLQSSTLPHFHAAHDPYVNGL
jgi:hypothetical protein